MIWIEMYSFTHSLIHSFTHSLMVPGVVGIAVCVGVHASTSSRLHTA